MLCSFETFLCLSPCLAGPLPTFSGFLVLSSFPLPQMSISQDSDLGRHSSYSTSPRVSSATPETEFRVVVIPGGSEYQISHRTMGLKTHNAILVLSHHDMCLCLPDYSFTWAHHSHLSHHQVLLPKAQPSSTSTFSSCSLPLIRTLARASNCPSHFSQTHTLHCLQNGFHPAQPGTSRLTQTPAWAPAAVPREGLAAVDQVASHFSVMEAAGQIFWIKFLGE